MAKILDCPETTAACMDVKHSIKQVLVLLEMSLRKQACTVIEGRVEA